MMSPAASGEAAAAAWPEADDVLTCPLASVRYLFLGEDQITWSNSRKWTRLPGFAQSGARLPGFAKPWTRLPGMFFCTGSGYLVWARLPGKGRVMGSGEG